MQPWICGPRPNASSDSRLFTPRFQRKKRWVKFYNASSIIPWGMYVRDEMREWCWPLCGSNSSSFCLRWINLEHHPMDMYRDQKERGKKGKKPRKYMAGVRTNVVLVCSAYQGIKEPTFPAGGNNIFNTNQILMDITRWENIYNHLNLRLGRYQIPLSWWHGEKEFLHVSVISLIHPTWKSWNNI